MRREIKVYSDDLQVVISTVGNGSYSLQCGEFSSLELSQDHLKELQYMIEEIIQLANKQDY